MAAGEHEPKISLVEIIFISLILGVVEFISAFIPVVGPWVALAVFGPLLDFYLWIKGLPMRRALYGQLAEIVPILNELPLLLAGFLFTVALDRNPKLAAATAVAGGAVTGAARGVAEAGEEAGNITKTKEAVKGGVRGAKEARQRFENLEAEEEGADDAENREESPEDKDEKNKQSDVSEQSFGMEPEPIEKLGRLFEEPPDEKNVIIEGNNVNLKNRKNE